MEPHPSNKTKRRSRPFRIYREAATAPKLFMPTSAMEVGLPVKHQNTTNPKSGTPFALNPQRSCTVWMSKASACWTLSARACLNGSV